MVQRVVIDSNMLQTPVLRAFLSEASDNVAVLPDFVWSEIYKQRSVAAVAAALSVIRDFSDRVVVLKSGNELAGLDPRHEDLAERMLLPSVENQMRLMTEAISQAERGEPAVMAQLVDRWSSATVHMDEMLEGAADQIYETLITAHDITRCNLAVEPRYNAYLYRYALAILVYALWWIRNGCQAPKRLDKARNDFIDLGFAVCGTYFAGLMTDDSKARWMYGNLSAAFSAVGARLNPAPARA